MADFLESGGGFFDLGFGNVDVGGEADAKGGAVVYLDLGFLKGIDDFGRVGETDADGSAALGRVGRGEEGPAVILG